MKIQNAQYVISAVTPEQFPRNNLPEVTVVGRSNVGKSTLINTLLNKKNLARVAATPGKTREINFFNIDQHFYFVDLPGYGYAKVSKAKQATWEELIDTYLNSRTQLKLIIMLVDLRHTPSEADQMMYEWLINRQISFMVVATKSDKIPNSQLQRNVQDIQATLKMTTEVPILFSAVTNQGKNVIWNQILQSLNLS